MKTKTPPTILEQTIETMPEFEEVLQNLNQQVTFRGQSKSTLQNYGRRIAWYVCKLPEQISE